MHDLESQTSKQNKNQLLVKFAPIAILVILFTAAGFFGGVFYQKNKVKGVSTSNANNRFDQNGGGPGGMGGMNGQRPNMGTVTAISSSSITVKNTRSNSEKIYTITSSTKVSDNGESVSINDIGKGDEVMVLVSSSESSEAVQIMLNPEQGGGFGPPSGNNDSSSSDSNIIFN